MIFSHNRKYWLKCVSAYCGAGSSSDPKHRYAYYVSGLGGTLHTFGYIPFNRSEGFGAEKLSKAFFNKTYFLNFYKKLCGFKIKLNLNF